MGIEVDGANQKLILDSDGDTYIEGATDDTLKVYVSGAQDFTITANTLTAESGSTIAAQALTATTVTASGIIKTDDATEATSTTDGSLQTDGGLSVVKDTVMGDDLKLLSDASVIHFGANSEITLTHSHDAGLNLKHTATADDKPVVLTLQTGETDIAANDVIGAINFQAPDEGTGTDAILVAAGIEAVSEGDFSSSSNATKLSFKTGASEAAAEKMSLSSAGLLTIADDLVIKDGGTIGVSSDADSITIASNGAVTFSQTPVFPDGSIAVADLDIDGATDIGADIVDADLFIIDDGAGGTNRKTTASRLKTYAGGANTPYFQASITSNQTLVHDTSTRISFDRADVDSASGFNTTYNKYTIPTGQGGYWHIGYGIAVYGSDETQINNINIYPNKDGSDWISFNSRHQGVSYYRFGSHQPRQFHAEKSFIGAAAAGDELTITAVLGHSSGGSNVLSVGEYYSVFWGYKLAGT
jgi:hypothetical protein